MSPSACVHAGAVASWRAFSCAGVKCTTETPLALSSTSASAISFCVTGRLAAIASSIAVWISCWSSGFRPAHHLALTVHG